MNELSEQEWRDYKADLVAVLVSLAIILVAMFIYGAVSTQEPYVNPVCRDEFGHRIECPRETD